MGKVQRWCRRLEADLRIDAGPYVVGQVVHGLLSAGWPVTDVRDPLDHLADHLARTPLSTAAFLDHAAALRALARAGSHPDVVDHTIDELFGSAYRRDGSWYHEPWYTAWALLALHEANAVRRVVVEQPRLDEYLARADDVLAAVRARELRRAADERHARLTVMVATALLLAGLAGVGFVMFGLPDSNRFFTCGLAITLVTALVAVAWRLLWPLLRLPHSP